MKTWQVILTVSLTAAVSFLFGYKLGGVDSPAHIEGDTLVIRDTTREPVPIPVVETVIREVPELFPVYVTMGGDTVHEDILVPVPVTVKEYATDSYRAWVSGYKPSLDSVWVYPKTERIYIREKARRWGIGISAGYGVGKDGLSPYIGAGVYWRVW